MVLLYMYLVIWLFASLVMYIFLDKKGIRDYISGIFKSLFVGMIWPMLIVMYMVIKDEEKII